MATAREALAGGRYADAVAAAGRAAKADPMLVEPHLIGGEALVNLGRDADAIRELRQAVYLQPDSASALLLLAGALDRQGEPAAAGRAYRSAAATVGDLPPEEVSAFFGGRSAAELVALCLRLATQAERTARASEIRQVQDTGDTMIGFVTFRLGDRQFACRLDEVREVVRLEGLDVLPGMTPPISGLLELRGTPLPVVDLRVGDVRAGPLEVTCWSRRLVSTRLVRSWIRSTPFTTRTNWSRRASDRRGCRTTSSTCSATRG